MRQTRLRSWRLMRWYLLCRDNSLIRIDILLDSEDSVLEMLKIFQTGINFTVVADCEGR